MPRATATAIFRQQRMSIRLDSNTLMRLQEFSLATGIPVSSTVRFAINEQLDKVYDADGYLKREFIKNAVASTDDQEQEQEQT